MAWLRVAGVLCALGAFVGAVGAGSWTREAAAAGDCWSINLDLDPEEVEFYLLINQYRADYGLQPLYISTNLTRAASWHAQDMGTRGYFGHDNPEGLGPQARANGCGYPYPAGENIAAGSNWTSAKHAFDAWRGSPSHNDNMLRPGYVQIGIARYYAAGSKYGWYWATSFGVQSDGSNGSDIGIAESGVRSAGLKPQAWNMATTLPGGLRVDDLRGYTAWYPLANGWYQQWAPGEVVPGGTKVGLLPIGMSLDKGRTPR
ncbi:MAG: CAP domain-containing protein [Dehalococcoidia bacterium]